jgi:TatD DNase family protein
MTNRVVLGFSRKFDEVKAVLGIYPSDALKLTDEEIDAEIKFIRENKDFVFGIGEVGMDFLREGDKARQEEIFRKFIKLSIELDKPITVHSRKAEKECIEILEDEGAKKVVMHCFFGDIGLIDRIVENGWIISIPTCCKHNDHFKEVIKKYPIENFLCETDSPFMHPDKEQHNEPANVIESYKMISEIKGVELAEVEGKIEENFHKLY